MMYLRTVSGVLALGVLGACSQAPETKGAAACAEAAMARSQNTLLTIDQSALVSSATAESGGIVQMQAPAVFNAGLSSEYTQTLRCRVDLGGDAPRVIMIEFVF